MSDRGTTKRGRRCAAGGDHRGRALRGVDDGRHPGRTATMVGVTRVEICKGGPVSSGSFLFSVNGSTTPVSVAVGTCKGVAVKPGSNTVKELPDTSGLTTLGKIQITPATAGVSNLAARSATVFVPSGGDVIARFVNEPYTSLLKVCAVAGDPSILGQSFSFTETANGTTLGPTSVITGTTTRSTAPRERLSDRHRSECGGDAESPTVVSSIQASGGTLSNLILGGGGCLAASAAR